MKIVVAIKQVPARDSQLRIAPSGTWIEEADLTYEINEPDAYALEAGLQLKEKHGGEVVVLCAGPGARGADHPRGAGQGRRPRASTSKRRTWARSIRWPSARLLAAALDRGEAGPGADRPAIRRSGLRPDRRDPGRSCSGCRTPPSSCRWRSRTARIRVKRELEDGWFQHVEMPLPALLTIQSGINKLRYATLMGIKKAKTKEVRRLTRGGSGR